MKNQEHALVIQVKYLHKFVNRMKKAGLEIEKIAKTWEEDRHQIDMDVTLA